MAKKNPVGRPPKFKTPKELEEMVDQYFIDGVRKKTKVVGGKAVKVPMPTITGLVLYLGFSDRHSFYDYEKREEFSHTIKKARTFIEMEYEELLQSGLTNAIFALKNMGWKDKTEIEHGATDKFAKAVSKGMDAAKKYGGGSDD